MDANVDDDAPPSSSAESVASVGGKHGTGTGLSNKDDPEQYTPMTFISTCSLPSLHLSHSHTPLPRSSSEGTLENIHGTKEVEVTGCGQPRPIGGSDSNPSAQWSLPSFLSCSPTTSTSPQSDSSTESETPPYPGPRRPRPGEQKKKMGAAGGGSPDSGVGPRERAGEGARRGGLLPRVHSVVWDHLEDGDKGPDAPGHHCYDPQATLRLLNVRLSIYLDMVRLVSSAT